MHTHAPPPSLLTDTTVYSLLSTLALLIAALALARLALPTARYCDSAQRSVTLFNITPSYVKSGQSGWARRCSGSSSPGSTTTTRCSCTAARRSSSRAPTRAAASSSSARSLAGPAFRSLADSQTPPRPRSSR